MRHVQSSMQDMFVDAGSQQKTAHSLHALKIILAPIRSITRKIFCCSPLCIMFFFPRTDWFCHVAPRPHPAPDLLVDCGGLKPKHTTKQKVTKGVAGLLLGQILPTNSAIPVARLCQARFFSKNVNLRASAKCYILEKSKATTCHN